MFFLVIPRPPSSTLFPYTTLFRSTSVIPLGTQTMTRGDERRSAALRMKYRSISSVISKSAITPCHPAAAARSEEHTSELQSHSDLVCRLLLEKKKTNKNLPQSTST